MRQIIAMGGGGFSMEPENLLLDNYILAQTKRDLPKVCFVPTASGDQSNYIERFYKAFKLLPCQPSHLSLLEPEFKDLEDFVLHQDVIYVGGGNTRNLLILWKEWGLDQVLKKAYSNGIILAGLSAGAICWFEEGLTDPLNASLYKLDCLGYLKGSYCPHYDGENKRKPSYHQLILEGNMKEGYAVDDGVALHFVNEKLLKSVSSRPKAKSYSVKVVDKKIIEDEINTIYLSSCL
ncbi:Type 1 glutamine amidotransferase-like domain-containing protein [Bacillus sp. CHD6a]|uniref:Type 1 glutamine amidotransferase-like domain-containing protein n=1 Tax=Bacillus sp. CHD6a TaxID=1643452 RepID=UPI0006CCC989|nr:Type 1 glutamine amidotransferase-like domain-containing protein [Bacillus sp. CHD6a]KPB06272.1 peptidase [Bacillus sp. CHD6a]